MEDRVQIDKRFIKACESPKTEEKSKNAWMELLEFLDQLGEAEVASKWERAE